MSKLRSFVRQNYTATMLGIIALSVVGSLLVLGYQVIRTNEQIALIQNIAQEISKDQQKQHDHQDERQACFFNLFVSYTNNTPRIPITQEDTNRCRVDGSDSPDVYTKSSQESTDSQTAPAQPAPKSATPATKPSENKPPQATPPQNAVDNLLEIVRMAL